MAHNIAPVRVPIGRPIALGENPAATDFGHTLDAGSYGLESAWIRQFGRNEARVATSSLTATAIAWSILRQRGMDCRSLNDQLQRNGSRDV
jgi:hypothetical protein